MTLVHAGIRPEYKTSPRNIAGRNYRYEQMPDESVRVWTIRMLTSGCNKELSKVIERDNLIYCEHCDEWFSKDQFKEIEK